MLFLTYTIYVSCCMLMAYDNAKRIENNKEINHQLNGLIHLTVAFFFLVGGGITACASSLLLARISFDWALNLFRGLGIDYVSPSPKSLVDRIEKLAFKDDGVTPKLIYILLFVILNF